MKKIIAALFILFSLVACSSEQAEIKAELEKTRIELAKTRAELEKINKQDAIDQERWEKSLNSDAIDKLIKAGSNPTSNNPF